MTSALMTATWLQWHLQKWHPCDLSLRRYGSVCLNLAPFVSTLVQLSSVTHACSYLVSPWNPWCFNFVFCLSHMIAGCGCGDSNRRLCPPSTCRHPRAVVAMGSNQTGGRRCPACTKLAVTWANWSCDGGSTIPATNGPTSTIAATTTTPSATTSPTTSPTTSRSASRPSRPSLRGSPGLRRPRERTTSPNEGTKGVGECKAARQEQRKREATPTWGGCEDRERREDPGAHRGGPGRKSQG